MIISKNNNLQGVQIARGLAALLVVIGHSLTYTMVYSGRYGLTKPSFISIPWGIGVDIFFIISGFIMVFSSESLFRTKGAWMVFLFKRFWRVVPLYWTIITIYLVRNLLSGREVPSLEGAIASYLFIPYDSLNNKIIRPFYEIGWTLNYEVFFYLIFAVFLYFKKKIACLSVFIVFLTFFLFGKFSPVKWPFFLFYSQPIIFEFCLGGLLGLFYKKNFFLSYINFFLIQFIFLFFVLSNDFFFPFLFIDSATPNNFLRLLFWGVPACFYIFSMIYMPNIFDSPTKRLLRFLGDISYSLYLSHPLVMGLLSSLCFKPACYLSIPFSFFALFLVISSLVFASLLFKYVEKPFLDLRKL
jgi:peptidoglycan/LPS O-acetylase OafA/YrhL